MIKSEKSWRPYGGTDWVKWGWPPIVVVALLLLTSCAGGTPWNKQQFIGITEAEIDLEGRTAKVITGREHAQAGFSYSETLDGVDITYTATETRSFDGARVRAEVEKEVSEDAKEALPTITDLITDIIEKLVAAGVL